MAASSSQCPLESAPAQDELETDMLLREAISAALEESDTSEKRDAAGEPLQEKATAKKRRKQEVEEAGAEEAREFDPCVDPCVPLQLPPCTVPPPEPTWQEQATRWALLSDLRREA